MGVPSNIILPFVGVEFDNSGASTNPGVLNIQALIFGQKTAAGTGTKDTIIKVNTAAEVGILGGMGSQIHQMSKKFRANNKTTDLYVYMLDDAAESTAAAYTITVTAATPVAGEIAIMVDGYRVPVSVIATDTATAIAAKIVTALTLRESDLPITSISNAEGVVSFSAKNKGTVANGLDVRFNYYDGEAMPSGVTAVFAVATPGATDPALATMITNLGDNWFHVIAGPYTDSTNLGAIEDELADRAGPVRQIDGVYVCAKKDTDADLITFATASGRNSQYVAAIACNKFPNAAYEIAAAAAGKFAGSIQNDAAKPLHRMELVGILPPVRSERAILTARNSLAQNGMCTLTTSNGVQTEACITMYLKNSAGVPDTSYKQLNYVFTLMVLRWRFIQMVLLKYPRAKLADTSANIGPGQQIITPAIGKALAVTWAEDAERDGLIENMDSFKASVICQRDPANRNKLNWILPPDLMNQLINGSADMAFIE